MPATAVRGRHPRRRRAGEQPELAATMGASLVRPHHRRRPGHRRPRQLVMGQRWRRARVRRGAEECDASTGEPGLRHGERARHRPPGPRRGQGIARSPRRHLSGTNCIGSSRSRLFALADQNRPTIYWKAFL